MNIGEKLLELRKSKQLSQEEVANKLNVTRQTVSKWETGQSMPDFDKILPICELYEISADELLSKTKNEKLNEEKDVEKELDNQNDKRKITEKKAKGIGLSILIYFIAVAWIMVTIPVFMMNPVLSSAVFLLICGIATYIMVYTCIVYKKEKTKKEEKENKMQKQINEIISIIILIIYLYISFTTMAWHITWIIWVVYGLIEEIIKLIFMLRSNKEDEE